MGCFQSKKDCSDIHPNVYRVVNIDEGGTELWSGQLEVTESDLILYREGRDATIWPLASLRRYGFDGDIFSFESGRRCTTGEGIYAFRCRRANALFRTLQQNIQSRNNVHDPLQFQMASTLATGSPSQVPRQTLQASVVHRSSVDNGLPLRNNICNNNLSRHLQNNLPHSTRQTSISSSNGDILEVTPLYPRPVATNQVNNVYQVKGFKARESNNNQDESNGRHVYTNDINRDLEILRLSLRQEDPLNIHMRELEDDCNFLKTGYANQTTPKKIRSSPLSPTLSNASEHYTQLSVEQEQARLYMNIAAHESALPEFNTKCETPSTPLTPRLPEYCNFNVGSKLEMNSYANLALGEMAASAGNIKNMFNYGGHATDNHKKFSDTDTFQSLSPVDELDLNYAVLDIDPSKEASKIKELLSPETSYASSKHESSTSQVSTQQDRSQSSLENSTSTCLILNPADKPPLPGVGYTTIDFDKTVALTSVVTGVDNADVDGSRKTRHNSSNATCGSPGNNDKNK